MAVVVAQVRTRISDQPYVQPFPRLSPEIIGFGDGLSTQFYVEALVPVPNTMIVYTRVVGSKVWVQTTAYTLPQPNLIQFNVAPSANTDLAARYQITAFLDTELSDMIVQAATEGFTEDNQVLKYCQYTVANILMTNTRLMKVLHRGDTFDDVASLHAGYTSFAKRLQEELYGNLRPGMNIPVGIVTSQPYVPYGPTR